MHAFRHKTIYYILKYAGFTGWVRDRITHKKKNINCIAYTLSTNKRARSETKTNQHELQCKSNKIYIILLCVRMYICMNANASHHHTRKPIHIQAIESSEMNAILGTSVYATHDDCSYYVTVLFPYIICFRFFLILFLYTNVILFRINNNDCTQIGSRKSIRAYTWGM